MDDQDWTVVTIKRSGRGGGSLHHNWDKKPVVPKTIVSKINHQKLEEASRLEATEIGRPKQLTSESRNEIIQKRVAMGLTQIQLNQNCRFPANTIREFEAGRICPNQQQIQTLNRLLKTSLKCSN